MVNVTRRGKRPVCSIVAPVNPPQSPPPDARDYEKLGLLYLGRPVDPETGETAAEPLLYDSRDLTTHAVCVGMTGSGKTGLCLSLLEEAAIDGVPALAIDPKGDVGNLLLTFPELRPEDFRPWVEEDEARRRGLDADTLAAETAKSWRDGLAEWGQDGERIARLRAAADFQIYTPGSDAGLPVSILSSFAAPPGEILEEADLFRDRVVTVASSLLQLLRRDADPVRSREHVFLSRLLEEAWRAGRDLDLADLVRQVQKPPFDTVGVMDLETVFPERERMDLAMALNNLLASPGFASWLTGTPLDLDRLLFTDEGRPRVAVISIAHLSEAERMFFVTLLLSQTLAWMRRGSGTGSLRALLYMDELFGYMPPVAEPPSKRGFLTLLKQARAYGLGLVLATQNPADLDYKGLSNAGTWFVGRLQTERDRERVIEGLLGASGGGLDRGDLQRVLGSLDKRVFMLQNVHEREPVLFRTRWALSYLAGPMTRQEIARVMEPAKAAEAARTVDAPAAGAPPPAPDRPAAPTTSAPPPLLPGDVPVAYLPAPGAPSRYRPAVLGIGRVTFVEAKRGIDHAQAVALLAEIDPEGVRPVVWGEAREIELRERDLGSSPPADGLHDEVPAPARDAKSYREWEKELSDHLYRARRLTLPHSPVLDLTAAPDEDERAFRIRLAPLLRAERDRRLGEVEARWAEKLERLDERLRKAAERVEREEDQAGSRKRDFWISAAATLGSALLGRKLTRGALGRATTAARGYSRVRKESEDVELAEAEVARLRSEREELAAELERELEALRDELDGAADRLETIEISPRRADVRVDWVGLAWVPE